MLQKVEFEVVRLFLKNQCDELFRLGRVLGSNLLDQLVYDGLYFGGRHKDLHFGCELRLRDDFCHFNLYYFT